MTTASRYRRLAGDFTARVDAVPAGGWDAPSPCEGWSARDVLAHLIEVHGTMLGYVGIGLPPLPSVDSPQAAWAATRDAMQAVLDDPERAGLGYDGYFGPTTLADTVDAFLCFDLVIHGWDIARATGLDTTIAPADIADVTAFTDRMGDNLQRSGVCGPAIPVPDDADAQTALLARLGRRS